MNSIALNPTAIRRRPAINSWIIAGIVVLPTFMEILDTTVANVALRYMAGGLSTAQSDAEWIITSYLAANAIVLPITGWLSAHLGGAKKLPAIVRVVVGGAAAMAVTWVIGNLFGAAIG